METPIVAQLNSGSPQLTADVFLYPADEGRNKLLGWGCLCCPSKSSPVFGYDGWPLLGDTTLSPGEKRKLGFVFLNGEESANALRKAGKFYLWEGKFIGEAVVIP
ncbi:MAG: hypothetical protein ACTHJS_00405 [Xanthobacteraceae bacterium]